MTNLEFHLKDLSFLPITAKKILKEAGDLRLFAFYGELGAGKTTLIQEMCRQLGVKQDVTSPTFALVNEYDSEVKGTVYHFDFYRFDLPEEALDIGLEEYIASGFICFMEWPEKIGFFLPDDCLKISIRVETDNSRMIKLEFPG